MKFCKRLYGYAGHMNGFFFARKFFYADPDVGEWSRATMVKTYKKMGRLYMRMVGKGWID